MHHTTPTMALLATLILAAPLASAGSDGPSSPTGLTAEVLEDGTVLLEWTAPAAGLEFNVYRNGDLLGVTESTSYSDEHPESVAEYVVSAVSPSAESDTSESVVVITVGASQGRDQSSPLLNSPAHFDAYGGVSSSCNPLHVSLAPDTPPFVFVALNDWCIPGQSGII